MTVLTLSIYASTELELSTALDQCRDQITKKHVSNLGTGQEFNGTGWSADVHMRTAPEFQPAASGAGSH